MVGINGLWKKKHPSFSLLLPLLPDEAVLIASSLSLSLSELSSSSLSRWCSYMCKWLMMRSEHIPTNIAGVNLVMGCSKGFFFHYSNTCPGVLTLYKWYENLRATKIDDPIASNHWCRHRWCAPSDTNIGWDALPSRGGGKRGWK